MLLGVISSCQLAVNFSPTNKVNMTSCQTTGKSLPLLHVTINQLNVCM